MSNADDNIKVISGTANRPLAEEVAKQLGVPLAGCLTKSFADGEVFVQIEENVRGCDVYLVQPTCYPVNDNLMELLLTVGALRRSDAAKITAVVPYYGYARQDRKDRPRTTISAADVARLMETMGVDRVVTVDLHADQIQGFFGPRCAVENVAAAPVALQYFKDKSLVNPVVVSPDAGGVKRAKNFQDGLQAVGLKAELAMIIKQRVVDASSSNQQVGQMDLVGRVEGCDCILVDDMIDTAGTLCAAAEELRAMGALRVFAYATHGLFNSPAVDRIEASSLVEVIVANTLPLQKAVKENTTKITEISVGPLLAETIRRLHTGESLSSMKDALQRGESITKMVARL